MVTSFDADVGPRVFSLYLYCRQFFQTLFTGLCFTTLAKSNAIRDKSENKAEAAVLEKDIKAKRAELSALGLQSLKL